MQQNDIPNLIPKLIYFVNRNHMPSWRIERGIINFHDLTYVYGGQATYIINGEEYKLQQGDFIYIPAGNAREATTSSDDPIQSFAVNFDLFIPGNDTNDIYLPFGRVIRTGLSSELISLYSQLDHIWVEKAYNYEMKARALFMLILDKLICRVASGDSTQPEDPRLLSIKQYILQNYMNRIEISELAKLACLNPVYLGAFFKQANGCTIKQYINRIRINNAESLLSTGGYSVSEAAVRSGFDDIFYFSKVYRNYKGYAPSILIKGKAGQ